MIKTCKALFQRDQVAELRILELKGSKAFTFNAAGWFNDWSSLADFVIKYEKQHPLGFYVTINPLHSGCIARTHNQVVERQKNTSSDRDVIGRNWFPIDIDPVRPSGISSSQEELVRSAEKGKEVSAYLEQELGWPRGIKAHSGNGIHLLYRIAMPNEDDSTQTIKACLEQLAEKFNDSHTEIDRTMSNAARIMRIWGTVARKGNHTADRPHRRSKLWTEGEFDSFEVVSSKKIEKILAGRPKKKSTSTKTKKKKKTRSKTGHHFDLDAWIDKHGIAIKKSEPFDGSGVRHFLQCCLFDSSHTGTSVVVGRSPAGSIFYKCQHASCSNRGWKEAREEVEGVSSEDEPESSTAWDLAIQFIEDCHYDTELGILIRRHRQQFHVYAEKENCYVATSEDTVRVQITRWLGDQRLQNGLRAVRDVMNSVASMVTVAEELDAPFMTKINEETKCVTADPKKRNLIALENGVLDVDMVLSGEELSKSLRPHTAEWFSTTSLKFPFPTQNDQMLCPEWMQFLNEIFEGDEERVEMIQQMFGYCFFITNRLERFFILQGKGSNGKSTLLDVLVLLLGENNTTALSLDQISDPRMRYELYGKTANICSDLPEMDRVEEGLIKRITSGEPVVCDRKYKDPIKFTPRCKLIFSTNPLPRFQDISLGIWRRMIIVPFEYIVPPSQIDPDLGKKFLEELPGIFVWALHGTSKLVRDRRFVESKRCDEANRQYKLSCFPVFTFLDECTRPDGEVAAKDVWMIYRKWCRYCGLRKPKPLHTFVKDITSLRPTIEYPRVPHGMVKDITLRNISLKPGLDFMTPEDKEAESLY